ncbi:MAG: LytR family transcriptional regulator [Fusobacteriaceae bacterium]|jgi:hypothetical protein|nr:LytR family transcriptional regulator [Fusobacteriaceae bacterium]
MAKTGENKNTMVRTKSGARRDSKLFQILITMAIIAVLAFILFRKLTNAKPVILDTTKKQLVIGNQNLIVVYENKLALVIPFAVNANKDETFGEIAEKQSDAQVLDAVNKVLPERVDEVKRIKKGEVRLDVKNQKMAPEATIDDKRVILTSSLAHLFEELYYEHTTVAASNENIIVDILNANGKVGYAKKTGEKIAADLKMKYNAANNDTPSDTSYVVLRDISKEKAQEVVMELAEKYIKIKNDVSIPTLANIVVILGKEEKISFEIAVYGKGDAAKKAAEELKSRGYKNVRNSSDAKSVDESLLEYNPEDYYIAWKIGQYLNIKNMIEKDDLNNRINVITK